jgi:hypothetical protein
MKAPVGMPVNVTPIAPGSRVDVKKDPTDLTRIRIVRCILEVHCVRPRGE